MDIKKLLNVMGTFDGREDEDDKFVEELITAYLVERDRSLEHYRRLENLMTGTQQKAAEWTAKNAQQEARIKLLEKQVYDSQTALMQEQAKVQEIATNRDYLLQKSQDKINELLAFKDDRD